MTTGVSVLDWALVIWVGALAYTMVGALVYRIVGPWHWCRCSSCQNDDKKWEYAALWPIFAVVLVIKHAVRSLVYIPFRATVRAIAKPVEPS